MPVFTYSALTESGSRISGELEAETAEAAANSLAGRGYIPLEVKRDGGSRPLAFWDNIQNLISPVGSREIILFTKQLRTMLIAGVPIINILETLEAQTENRQLRNIIIEIGSDIKEGSSLYDAFRKHPSVFSNLYCSMIRAGESSGALVDVVSRLIYITEHEAKVKSDIRAAMFYPAIVVCFLAVAFFVLLMYVIPKFVSIFQRAGIVLPMPTRVCLFMYKAISTSWPYLLVGIAVGGFLLLRYLKTEQGRLVRDSVLMRIPLIGELVVKGAMSRFASIFSILQHSGVPVLESLSILADALGNAVFARQIGSISEDVREGRGLSDALRNAKHFPPMVISMIAIGEESGNLEEMMAEIAVHYDAEVEYTTKRLSDSLGPFLTVALAIVVGFFALAIFLPMWDLTKMV
ncbi:MAG: general secretion pathway protein GspF [Desulfococcus sp. 4484_241]|nr:MAG: general secretion pathway protein GspF [Desulfococcus sp. 4484_241]